MNDESNALADRLRFRCNAMHEYADSELMCEAAAQIESLTRDVEKYQKRAHATVRRPIAVSQKRLPNSGRK